MDDIQGYFDRKLNEGMKNGDIMESLTDPKILTPLFPEWNNPVETNTFNEGDFVKFKNPHFIKKYPPFLTIQEINYSEIVSQATEIYNFIIKNINKSYITPIKRSQCVQQYSFNKRKEKKEFLYLSTGGVTEKNGWCIIGTPISNQKKNEIII